MTGEGEGVGVEGILHVDIVASTAMLAKHGVQAQIDVRRTMDAVVERAAGGHRGAVLDTRGDGTLVRFESATSGLRAATQIQREVTDAGSFEVRAGLTVGEGGDGTRARQVEQWCPAGSVAIDGVALRSIERSDVDGSCEPLGDGLDVFVAEGAVAADADAEVGVSESSSSLRVVMFSEASTAEGSDVGLGVLTGHGADVIDTNGFGHVALFATASAALAASDELHRIAAAHNLRSDVAAPLSFTVGVSLGDVVTSQDAHFGHAVIEAARLMAAAEPGSTVCSRDASTVARRTDGRELGPLTLKGFDVAVDSLAFEAHPAPELLALPPQFSRGHRFGFSGRAEDFEGLNDLWRQSAGGDVRASVVIGEEGSGKSRLVEELANVVHADGGIVLAGSCSEELARPFQAVVEALGRLAGLDGEIADAVERRSGVLAPIFDGVAGRDVDGAAADRAEMFGEVAAVLERVAAMRPVLLVIDDVQWATVDTLQLLEMLITSAAPCRLMVAATCRAENLDRSHPVEQHLLSARREGHAVERRRLDRLSADDIVAMLESRTERPLEASEVEFAHTVAQVTGGSPLYAEELVTHLANTGVVSHDGVGWVLNVAPTDLPIPESVTSLMAARLARLGDDAVDVLTAAAVIGASFDLEVLATVKDRTLEEVLDITDAAATARLVFDSESGDRCSFSDELVRAALLADVRPSRRGLVHQRIAEVLEAERPHEIDQLAIHWERSPGIDAKRRAISALRRVADRDLGAAALESGVARLRRVIELLDETGSDDPAVLGEVRYLLGSALRTLGDRSYRPELVEAGVLARRSSDGVLLGRAAAAMMRPGAWFPEASVIDHEIIEMCEDALELLDASSPMRARVLAVLATNLAYHPDIERRRALLHEAQQLARADGDLALIGATLVAEVLTEREPHRFERRREVAAELRRIGRVVGDRDLAFVGGLFTLLETYAQGRLDDGLPLLDELQAAAEDARAYWHCFLMTHFRTATAIFRCESDAQDRTDAQRERFQHHEVDWFGVWTIQTASIALANGTLSQMLMSLSDVTTASADDDEWAMKWNYAIAKAHMEAGRFDDAVAAIEVNWDPAYDDYWLVSVQNLGLLGLEMQRADWCEMAIERLTPYRGRLGIIGVGAAIGAQISTSLGQAALGLGDTTYAEELFRESVAQAEAMRAPFFATNSRRFLARALLAADPASSEAAALIQTNLSESRRFGFALEEVEAKNMLERMGILSEH